MQGSQINTYSFRSSLVIRLVAACWLLTKLLCYKLWLADRTFPLIPVNNILVGIPNYIHILFFTITLVALLVLFAFPAKKWIAILIIIAELASCLLDQSRWQPWEYQFLFMFLPFAFLSAESKIKFCWQIILSGMYFFSGLGKFNHGFIREVWDGLILQQWLHYNAAETWVLRLGYLLPAIEMFAGIALLFNRTRKGGVILLCCMHIFNLVLLGPLGIHFNSVIWPWNILMPFLLVALFYKEHLEYHLMKTRQVLQWFVVVCWWLLPWFNLAGYWDNFLSAELYSGKSKQLYICTTDPVKIRSFHKYYLPTTRSSICDSSISVYKWIMDELNVVPNAEMRIYKGIIYWWEKTYDPAAADRFFIYDPEALKENWISLPAGK